MAPDLYHGGRTLGCVVSVVRDAARGAGPTFDELDAVRRHLVESPVCTGAVGVMGFCLGGGFAVLLAQSGCYRAASVNYGSLPRDPGRVLRTACPVVASYGARDRTLRDVGPRLAAALSANGVSHDVKTYPDAGHGFLNDHGDDDVPWFVELLAWASNTAYDESAAADARQRIVDFFRAHIGSTG